MIGHARSKDVIFNTSIATSYH